MEKYTRKYIFDDGLFRYDCKVIDIFEKVNKEHPFNSMLIAKIFYYDSIIKCGVCRYVNATSLQITTEECPYKGNLYELFKEYGGEYYIEDGIYKFVCYDGIKI